MTNPTLDLDALPDSALITPKQTQAVLCIGNTTFWRYIKDGILPKPRKIGPQAVRHTVGEIREFIRASQPEKAA